MNYQQWRLVFYMHFARMNIAIYVYVYMDQIAQHILTHTLS